MKFDYCKDHQGSDRTQEHKRTGMTDDHTNMPLAAQLRAHANSKNRTVAWEAQARMLMRWAADVIDAANEAIMTSKEPE